MVKNIFWRIFLAKTNTWGKFFCWNNFFLQRNFLSKIFHWSFLFQPNFFSVPSSILVTREIKQIANLIWFYLKPIMVISTRSEQYLNHKLNYLNLKCPSWFIRSLCMLNYQVRLKSSSLQLIKIKVKFCPSLSWASQLSPSPL